MKARKLTSLLLALVLALAFIPMFAAVPATANGETPRIQPVASTPITRDQYRSFGGIRHTSNNDTRELEQNITFVADNNNLNSWYIHVTSNITGSIDVAYQIGSEHFTRTIDINGIGRYIIGDSRGRNGLNEIRIRDFVSDLDDSDEPSITPIPNLSIRHFTPADIATSEICVEYRFVKGEILISAALDAAYSAIHELVASRGGEIVGYLATPNEYQAYFGSSATEEELRDLIRIFNANEYVILAMLNLVACAIESYPPQHYDDPAPSRLPEYFEAATLADSPPPPVNDALWRDQWDDYWDGEAGGLNWGMEFIDAPVAWRFNGEIANTMKIGVFDSNFYIEHEDLPPVLPIGNIRSGGTQHGTQVAGIIGANANNEIGIAGVLHNAEMFVYSSRSVNPPAGLSEVEESLFNIKHGLESLFAEGANIVNVSQGYGSIFAPYANELSPFQIRFLRERGLGIGVFLQKYLDMERDFVIVQSAGNQSGLQSGNAMEEFSGWFDTRYNGLLTNIPDENWGDEIFDIFPDLPRARFPEVNDRVIVVGNMEMATRVEIGNAYVLPGSHAPRSRNRADSSNFRIRGSSQLGDRVDVLAPGGDILTTTSIGTIMYQTTSGTSFSAPHVTGVAGMVWGLNPNLTGAEIKDIIIKSSETTLSPHANRDFFSGGAIPPENTRRNYPTLNAGSAALETLALRENVELSSSSRWARLGIIEAALKGFIPENIKNSLQNVITRREFCQIAVRWLEYALGNTIDEILSERNLSRNPDAFTDTSDPDILAAYAIGITSGVGESRFDPNGELNREQAAMLIMNTVRIINPDIEIPETSDFADLDTASDWALPGIRFVEANGIMSGTGMGNFSPKAAFTREQSIITFNNIGLSDISEMMGW